MLPTAAVSSTTNFLGFGSTQSGRLSQHILRLKKELCTIASPFESGTVEPYAPDSSRFFYHKLLEAGAMQIHGLAVAQVYQTQQLERGTAGNERR